MLHMQAHMGCRTTLHCPATVNSAGGQASALLTVSLQFVVCCSNVQQRGAWTGGAEEADAAFDEAHNAIFSLQLERHCHTQPYISKKDGRSKWAMIEMSPMIVSMTARPLSTNLHLIYIHVCVYHVFLIVYIRHLIS